MPSGRREAAGCGRPVGIWPTSSSRSRFEEIPEGGSGPQTSGPPTRDRRGRPRPVRRGHGQPADPGDGVAHGVVQVQGPGLEHLLAAPGRVFSREELLAQVWGYAAVVSTRTVDVHVAQVRAKLGDASPIRTVRGVGYSAEAGQ